MEKKYSTIISSDYDSLYLELIEKTSRMKEFQNNLLEKFKTQQRIGNFLIARRFVRFDFLKRHDSLENNVQQLIKILEKYHQAWRNIEICLWLEGIEN